MEIAAAAPADTGSYFDSTAGPGIFTYEVEFNMPGAPCPSLTDSTDSWIQGLSGSFDGSLVQLNWSNVCLLYTSDAADE